MNYTTHAAIRARQRVIPELVVDLLLQFGAREKAPGGVFKAFFDKASRRRVQKYAGPLAPSIQEHLNSYLVLNENDIIVTVGHRTERIPRH